MAAKVHAIVIVRMGLRVDSLEIIRWVPDMSGAPASAGRDTFPRFESGQYRNQDVQRQPPGG